MEKTRTLASRKYIYLSCRRFFQFKGDKNVDESLVLTMTNNGGEISFRFIDLTTSEETLLENPSTGEYEFPLRKGHKVKLLILASKAIGSYKIAKKKIVPNM